MTTEGQIAALHKFVYQENLDRFDFGNGFSVRVEYDNTYIKNANTAQPTIYHLDKNNHLLVSYEGEEPSLYDKHIEHSGYKQSLSAITQKIDELRANRFIDDVSFDVQHVLTQKKAYTI